MKTNLTFDAFKAQYLTLLRTFMAYSPEEIGSQIYAERLGALQDSQPAWTEVIDNQIIDGGVL
jgi:hypothetical protein